MIIRYHSNAFSLVLAILDDMLQLDVWATPPYVFNYESIRENERKGTLFLKIENQSFLTVGEGNINIQWKQKGEGLKYVNRMKVQDSL